MVQKTYMSRFWLSQESIAIQLCDLIHAYVNERKFVLQIGILGFQYMIGKKRQEQIWLSGYNQGLYQIQFFLWQNCFT